jgi:hypothetical protein
MNINRKHHLTPEISVEVKDPHLGKEYLSKNKKIIPRLGIMDDKSYNHRS